MPRTRQRTTDPPRSRPPRQRRSARQPRPPHWFTSDTGKAARARVGLEHTTSDALGDLANEGAHLVRLARRLQKIALDPKTKPREAIEAGRLRMAVLERARALRNPGSKDEAGAPPQDDVRTPRSLEEWAHDRAAERLAAWAASGQLRDDDVHEDATATPSDATEEVSEAAPATGPPPPDPQNIRVIRLASGRYVHPDCALRYFIGMKACTLSEAPLDPDDDPPGEHCAACGFPFGQRPPFIRTRYSDQLYHYVCAPKELRAPDYEVDRSKVTHTMRCNGCGDSLLHPGGGWTL